MCSRSLQKIIFFQFPKKQEQIKLMFFNTIYLYIDQFFIFFFRFTDNPLIGYYTGIAVLSLISVILGEFTISIAFRFNKKFIDHDNSEMIKMQNLSIHALVAKDKTHYKACNHEANEAFGKVFFTQIALASSSLWPVPFAMAWMQTRFGDVAFMLPGKILFIGDSVGYAFTFIPMYILIRILFSKIEHKLPYFKKMQRILAAYNGKSEKMLSFADLIKK